MSSVSALDATEIGMKPADLRALKAQLKLLLPWEPASDLILAIDCFLANQREPTARGWLRMELENFHGLHG